MSDSGKNAQEAARSAPAIDSTALFAGGNELVIMHNGTPYRLRITRQDKLILTK